MSTEYKWDKVKNTLPNLNVLSINGVEKGFIYKPMDDKHNKNAWRIHVGIGDKTKFINHEYDLKIAKRQLEKLLVG